MILVCSLLRSSCILKVFGEKNTVLGRLLINTDEFLFYLLIQFFVFSAFAELQTDLTDLTSDLHGIGMPFVSHREYASNMLFIGQERPDTQDKEVSVCHSLTSHFTKI